MQIITRRSDSTHGIAFGTREAAQRFIATASNSGDWTFDGPAVGVTAT